MKESETVQRPVKRQDAFFGLHFDLHPQKTDTSLGADITEQDLETLLHRVRPDYIQYDCKGHAGYTGYPTKVGWASPGIVKDSLALWRNATRQAGVGLFIHYSGVWDSAAIEHHPDWARVDGEGKQDPNATSTFGPYVDELLIPQLKEVTEAYDLDGFWVDGEAWATQLDYSGRALAAWQAETGLTEAPRKREDPHWLEWKMFHRRQFEKYLSHWVDALHEFRPDLQITSNWAYTTFMPQPVLARLDYLSGDYSPTVSVDRARVEARYLSSTGMPWDLMAWGFNWNDGYGQELKPALQLQQEAAAVLMQGGGFQIYYQPTRSGFLCPQIVETSGAVADFCRARQSVSHKSVSVPQVALLLSSETQGDRSDAVFTPYGCMDELEGALHALLDLQTSVDILAEHQLQPILSQFPLVVIPDSHKLSQDFKDALQRYVSEGGNLLLVGQQCARLFEPVLGVTLDGAPQQVAAELSTSGGLVNVNGMWQKVVLTTGQSLAFRFPAKDSRSGGECAATLASYGQGKIAAVWGPVALAYFRTHHVALKSLMGDLLTQLFPDPTVKLNGPPCLEVALRKTRDGRLSVHLLNVAQAQRADRFLHTDFIPPVGPVDVTLTLDKRPKRVLLEPGARKLKSTWEDGVLSVRVPSVEVHDIVVVDVGG